MTIYKGKQARKEKSKAVTVPELPWKKGMCDYDQTRKCEPKKCSMQDCPEAEMVTPPKDEK